MPGGFWGSWDNLTWSSHTCSRMALPSELGTKGGVFFHNFPYKCPCLERGVLIALWIISRPARSAWLPAKLAREQPPRHSGASLPGHHRRLSPKPDLGRWLRGSSLGCWVSAGWTPKILHGWGGSSQGAEMKRLCLALARAITNLAVPWDVPPLGCPARVGIRVRWKCSLDLEASLLEEIASVLTPACVDVLKLSVCVSACRIRTSVINNN